MELDDLLVGLWLEGEAALVDVVGEIDEVAVVAEGAQGEGQDGRHIALVARLHLAHFEGISILEVSVEALRDEQGEPDVVERLDLQLLGLPRIITPDESVIHPIHFQVAMNGDVLHVLIQLEVLQSELVESNADWLFALVVGRHCSNRVGNSKPSHSLRCLSSQVIIETLFQSRHFMSLNRLVHSLLVCIANNLQHFDACQILQHVLAWIKLIGGSRTGLKHPH